MLFLMYRYYLIKFYIKEKNIYKSINLIWECLTFNVIDEVKLLDFTGTVVPIFTYNF